jgi:NDP-mannose synthase
VPDRTIALIMAGGSGTRMARTRPDVPKPLVRVCGIPIVEILIRQILQAGVRDVRLALRHGADRIIRHFSDGRVAPAGVVKFLVEERPLGTIGALAQLHEERKTILVANGDLLSGVPLAELFRGHRDRAADLTIATHTEYHRLRLGEVVVGAESRVLDYVEKPIKEYRISSGIYLIEPPVLDLMVEDEWLPFPDLARRAIDAGLRVLEHPHLELWIDVNDEADLATATEMVARDPVAFGLDPEEIRERPGAI